MGDAVVENLQGDSVNNFTGSESFNMLAKLPLHYKSLTQPQLKVQLSSLPTSPSISAVAPSD
jgi:hypothetical protein